MNYYQQAIREEMAAMGRIGAADPRHVEAWMRLEHSTLDGLSRSRFTAEVKTALDCIAAVPTSESESLAKSFGL
ncbi:MAG TPA: hypothetical protein PLL30_16230 [Candidatus Krumholzibacteria bacterium]|nr:hypothetical protein [Candidatus Krumholzibacteria bacterium]HRY42035.1 hypothetical protein [Candidatus Krumholzibacteria bacterium]